MERFSDNADGLSEKMIQAALHYLEMGFRPIPLEACTKKACIKWKRLQTEAPTEAEVRTWFGAGDRPNIALVSGNGLVVVDVDAADQNFLQEVIEHVGDTPMRSRTPSGGTHLFYRMRAGVHYGNSVKVRGKPIDLRCEGGYVVVPWSRNDQGTYEWTGQVLPVSELPLLRVSWLRDRKPKRMLQPVEVSENIDTMVRRARAYLSHVEGSVSGNRGHDRAMRAAGILCQKFGLSVEQAFPVFKEWSETSCDPPWNDREILHKLQEAIRLRFERGLRPIK